MSDAEYDELKLKLKQDESDIVSKGAKCSLPSRKIQERHVGAKEEADAKEEARLAEVGREETAWLRAADGAAASTFCLLACPNSGARRLALFVLASSSWGCGCQDARPSLNPRLVLLPGTTALGMEHVMRGSRC